MHEITRRVFLKSAAATGVMLSVGGCSLFKPSHLEDQRCVGGGTDSTEYDYIVVGSGAGGGPVAANLANAGYRVLLLEAGAMDETATYSVPAFHPLSTEDPALQWNYYVRHYVNDSRQNKDTKRDKNGKGIWYPRAGTLGGCTAHNAMITVYPHESDWNRIAALTRDTSWSSDKMRRFFQTVENCQYSSWFWDSVTGGRHGFQGWLPTSRPTDKALAEFIEKDPQLKKILAAVSLTVLDDLSTSTADAILHRAIPKVVSAVFKKDINHMDSIKHRPEGLYLTPLATKDGKRASVRDRLHAVQQYCPNQLHIKTNMLVTKILLEKDSAGGKFKAFGVQCREGRHLYRADPMAVPDMPASQEFRARKEVIISTGAFNTPQLLMLSGIGPREELERHGIPVQIELPGVGKNLQDRYEVGIVYKMKAPFTTLEGARFQADEQNDLAYKEWKHATPEERKQGKGFLYSSNGVVIAILKRSSVAKRAKQDPDVFIFGLPSDFRGYARGYTKNIAIKDHFTWLILKGHTHNTGGTVGLRSSDPRDTPEINFAYFEEGNDPNKGKEDLDAIVEGVALIRKIMSHLVKEGQAEEVWPGPSVSDNALREWIMNEAWGHHASCSCKIGADEDFHAVLDSSFLVRGTTNLRVVDASIFPYIPGFFIVTPIYMIAEKASEVILIDANRVAT